MPHFAGLAVFFAVEPFFGAFHRREFENYDAFRIPIAFENFGFATADDIFASVLMNRGRRLFLVFFVADWIDNFYFDDNVSSHNRD